MESITPPGNSNSPQEYLLRPRDERAARLKARRPERYERILMDAARAYITTPHPEEVLSRYDDASIEDIRTAAGLAAQAVAFNLASTSIQRSTHEGLQDLSRRIRETPIVDLTGYTHREAQALRASLQGKRLSFQGLDNYLSFPVAFMDLSVLALAESYLHLMQKHKSLHFFSEPPTEEEEKSMLVRMWEDTFG